MPQENAAAQSAIPTKTFFILIPDWLASFPHRLTADGHWSSRCSSYVWFSWGFKHAQYHQHNSPLQGPVPIVQLMALRDQQHRNQGAESSVMRMKYLKLLACAYG